MLGLRKGTLDVVAYKPEWAELFVHERCILLQHLNDLVLDIQHIGSTAVPGLDAKPILDIAVAVTSLVVIPQCRDLLLAIGYIDRRDTGANGGYLCVKESAPQVRTHHPHVITADDPQWRNYLPFRELLRMDEELRSRYATLKNSLQQQFAHDRKAYTTATERGVLLWIMKKLGAIACQRGGVGMSGVRN